MALSSGTGSAALNRAANSVRLLLLLMPELPEVEHVRQTLEPHLLGAKIVSVELRRRDVLRSSDGKRKGRVNQVDLLAGTRVARVIRHGKNLAIVADNGRLVCIHLGMTGQLFIKRFHDDRPQLRSRLSLKHVHCIWQLHRVDAEPLQLIFRDPRRFGGMWAFDSNEMLCQQRVGQLGPDALSIAARQLRDALKNSARPIKAALLDQATLAGVGNIYADEALFLSAIRPQSRSKAIPAERVAKLANAIRVVLRRAIKAGGSSVRDYVDGNGNAGKFALRHKVYGRGNQPCLRCGSTLKQGQVGQRTTVWCGQCQRPYR